MIKNFHVLYVGQIELDNIGLAGTPANDRRYSDERLREAFGTARDVAQHMDRLGYDGLWTAEHHFQREGYECLPNLIPLGLWLATQTERLKFGCVSFDFEPGGIGGLCQARRAGDFRCRRALSQPRKRRESLRIGAHPARRDHRVRQRGKSRRRP